MPITPDDVFHFAKLQAMTDDDFLNAWHAAILANSEQKIAIAESVATHRFEIGNWQERYAARYPDQTYYKVPSNKR